MSEAMPAPAGLLRRRTVLLLVAGTFAIGVALAKEPPLVAAASDLKFALEEIAADFRAAKGADVRLVFGSSGNFARQIRQGAPFSLFLSADEAFVLGLARDGWARDAGVLYAVGRIAVAAAPDSPIAVDSRLDGIAAALAEGRLERFAIANPEHAPYGLRAKEALVYRGLWSELEPRLVYGENIAQTTQFVVSGSVPAGIVALSLALAPPLAGKLRYAAIPAEWHEPLNQRMALLRHAGPMAEAFYAWLQSERARAVFRRYGFLLPGESH
ncbi:Molybdate-binding periplasmic protein [bacterium HR40]|nr:Molybdate-binding periplasmic protein [bacterium HR40]